MSSRSAALVPSSPSARNAGWFEVGFADLRVGDDVTFVPRRTGRSVRGRVEALPDGRLVCAGHVLSPSMLADLPGSKAAKLRRAGVPHLGPEVRSLVKSAEQLEREEFLALVLANTMTKDDVFELLIRCPEAGTDWASVWWLVERTVIARAAVFGSAFSWMAEAASETLAAAAVAAFLDGVIDDELRAKLSAPLDAHRRAICDPSAPFGPGQELLLVLPAPEGRSAED